MSTIGGSPTQLSDAEIRELRVERARRNSRWTEIPAGRIERRALWLCDTETDLLYTRHRGATFSGPSLAFNEQVPLAFMVSDGDVTMLEPSASPRTWTEYLECRQRRNLRAV